jgi:hypothetical protein
MDMFSRLLASAAMLALAGCQTTAFAPRVAPQAGSLDAGWGEASKYNAAVQTINPDPVYAVASAQPGDNGDKAANATKRYRTDAVKEPELPSTTSERRSGGSGGPQ